MKRVLLFGNSHSRVVFQSLKKRHQINYDLKHVWVNGKNLDYVRNDGSKLLLPEKLIDYRKETLGNIIRVIPPEERIVDASAYDFVILMGGKNVLNAYRQFALFSHGKLPALLSSGLAENIKVNSRRFDQVYELFDSISVATSARVFHVQDPLTSFNAMKHVEGMVDDYSEKRRTINLRNIDFLQSRIVSRNPRISFLFSDPLTFDASVILTYDKYNKTDNPCDGHKNLDYGKLVGNKIIEMMSRCG